jgi:hypothetical protein
MSLSTLPDVSPRKKLSIVEAFPSAPLLVKVLAACLYLEALLRLGEAFAAIPGLGDDTSNVMANARVVFFGLALALIPFLLGNGIARGSHHAWLLTLVLVVVEIPLDLRSVLTDVTVISILNVVMPVVVLALLLTLFVRQHFTKR